MKKLFVLLILAAGGYIVYLKLTDNSPPFAIPFFSSAAYTTYQKFATALVHGRFEEAKAFAEGPAIGQLAEAERLRSQIVAMRMHSMIQGISYNKESETRSDGGKQVHLQILQVVRVDPPGQTSVFGTPVAHHHKATMKKTDTGWKVESFIETVGTSEQNSFVDKWNSSLFNSRDSSSQPESVIESSEERVVRATPVAASQQQMAIVSEALKFKSQVDIQSLERAIAQFNEFQGRFPLSLDELVQREVLEQLPEAPSGTKFIYHSENGTIELAVIEGSNTATKRTNSTKPILGEVKDMLNVVGNTQAAADLKKIRVAINVYLMQEDRYPSSLEDLVKTRLLEGLPILPDGKQFSYDPSTGKVAVVSK